MILEVTAAFAAALAGGLIGAFAGAYLYGRRAARPDRPRQPEPPGGQNMTVHPAPWADPRILERHYGVEVRPGGW